MVCRWEGGDRDIGGGVSVQSIGEMGKDFCPNFSNRFLKTDRRACNDGAYSSISQPSPKIPTLSFGGGSHLEVTCRGALLGGVEREEGKTGSDQYLKDP